MAQPILGELLIPDRTAVATQECQPGANRHRRNTGDVAPRPMKFGSELCAPLQDGSLSA
jgi:hypothetical protein